jgi:WD repeat-containing protein 68
MAVSSYNTDSMNNQVDIIDLNFDKPNDGFKKINEFKHEFPPTKIMWIPDIDGQRKDIMATTAEYLRVWEVQEETNTFKEHKILRNVS